MGKPVARMSEIPARVRAEATIVLGQRKLLQRLVPGLMHAFIFWGFLVLFPTIFIAMVAIVDREPSLPAGSPLGWLESQGWYALLVDVFVVLVLAGVATAFFIRKVQRPRRFVGSHLGEADLILALIAGIVTTLLLWHASLIALGLNPWPAEWSPVSNAVSDAFGDDGTTDALALRLGPRADHPRLPRVPPALEAPTSRRPRSTSSSAHARAGASSRSTSRPRTRALALRRRHGRRPHVEADARRDVVHRVRPLPGRLPGVRDRQGLSPKLLIMGIRDQLFAEDRWRWRAARSRRSSRTRSRTTSSGTA